MIEYMLCGLRLQSSVGIGSVLEEPQKQQQQISPITLVTMIN